MPVRKHGRGWEARVQYAGQRSSRTFADRQDALAWERKIQQRHVDSQLGRTPRYTVEEALERWLRGEASLLKSHADLIDKTRTLYPFLRGRALVDVVAVAEDLKSAGLKAGSAPATINRKLAILRRVANLAWRQWGWLDQPLGQRVRLLPGERQRHEYLTPAEVAKLASHAPNPAVRDAILMAAMSGLRRGELLALRPYHRVDGSLTLALTKSGRPRVVPIPPEAVKIRLPIGLTKMQLAHGFDAARKAAGIDVRFHDLRHTYASWLVQAGVHLTAVRDLLGHSSSAVTDRYSHLATGQLRQAVDKLPRIPVGHTRGRNSRKKAA